MKTSKEWKKYKNKFVELIINDIPYPRKRDGLFLDCDDTHIFLQTEFSIEPTPFLRNSIKRIDLKVNKEIQNGK